MTPLLLALVLSGVAVGALTWLLDRRGLVDVPNHRSSHRHPVPRGGGLAVVPVVALTLAVTGGAATWSAGLAATLVAAGLLGAVGLVDDLRDLPATVRLATQVLAGAVLAVVLLRDLSVPILVLALLVPVVAVWLTGFVNVYNFMDGANGVAAGQAAVAGGWYAVVGAGEGDVPVTSAAAATAGAALGFLVWNYPRAKVFLGDVGSYSVGLLLGGLAVLVLLRSGSVLVAVAPLLVFLADTSTTLLRRASARQPVMTAHREHVYQQLTATPGSPWPAVATTTASAACVAVVALADGPAGLVGLALVLGAYLAAPRVLGARRRGRP